MPRYPFPSLADRLDADLPEVEEREPDVVSELLPHLNPVGTGCAAADEGPQ